MTEEIVKYDEMPPGKIVMVKNDTPDHSPAAMLMQALAVGQDIDKIEKMLELQIRYEENEAKKAYHKAMAAFKANPPDIEKDHHVGFDSKKGGASTSYSHATLHNVATKINRAMSPHGLHASFKTDQNQSGITVTCTVTHQLGHSESTSLTAGADNTGNKNSIQAIGSTISYLERYTLLALTGLATRDMDDDARSAEPPEYITGKDLQTIVDLHKKLYNNPQDPKFWKFAGAKDWNTIPKSNFEKILNMLNERKVAQATREPGSEG